MHYQNKCFKKITDFISKIICCLNIDENTSTICNLTLFVTNLSLLLYRHRMRVHTVHIEIKLFYYIELKLQSAENRKNRVFF